jgi:hypothetical protein
LLELIRSDCGRRTVAEAPTGVWADTLPATAVIAVAAMQHRIAPRRTDSPNSVTRHLVDYGPCLDAPRADDKGIHHKGHRGSSTDWITTLRYLPLITLTLLLFLVDDSDHLVVISEKEKSSVSSAVQLFFIGA